ncbi:hypothetical protein ACFFRR_006809 [Megaselia abdita]
MNKFMILCFVASIGLISGQYNYPQQTFPVFNQPQVQQHQQINNVPVSPQHFSTAPSLLTFGAPNSNVRKIKHHSRVLKPIVTKSFFIHSAPEETEEEIQQEMVDQQPRNHYNVLFIKAPSQTTRATALNYVRNLNQEKTVVYVLSKKHSAAEIQQAVNDVPVQKAKPEVFFIKYKTPEEALHAQKEIQAQYDTLGGTATISNEGYAPVTSVIGALEQPEEEIIETNEINQPIASNNGYIPPQAANGYLPPQYY